MAIDVYDEDTLIQMLMSGWVRNPYKHNQMIWKGPVPRC